MRGEKASERDREVEILRWEMNRKRVLELLDSKIEIVKEEIEDAKSENDLTTKRNLMQILQQLERKRDKIRAGKTMGAR